MQRSKRKGKDFDRCMLLLSPCLGQTLHEACCQARLIGGRREPPNIQAELKTRQLRHGIQAITQQAQDTATKGVPSARMLSDFEAEKAYQHWISTELDDVMGERA